MRRYHITVGAKTTVDGTVHTGRKAGSGNLSGLMTFHPSKTPEWRVKLRDKYGGGTAYWRAGDKYQIMLEVNRFRDIKRPTEERYLMTLQLAKSRGDP